VKFKRAKNASRVKFDLAPGACRYTNPIVPANPLKFVSLAVFIAALLTAWACSAAGLWPLLFGIGWVGGAAAMWLHFHTNDLIRTREEYYAAHPEEEP